MENSRKISSLGPDIYTYIKESVKKEDHPLYKQTLAQIAKNALGISYNNLKIRLEDNNLKLHEVEKLTTYLNWRLKLIINDRSYEATTQTLPMHTLSESEISSQHLLDKQKIIDLLEEKIRRLESELKLVTKNDHSDNHQSPN